MARRLAKVTQRRERILNLVGEQERVTVDALAAALRISRETIRRDLSELAALGKIRKIHGAATLAEAHREGSLTARIGQAIAQKQAIAGAAAQLFGPGETLFVDTGSTTLLFAEALAAHPGLTVITNGTGIAESLGKGDAKVFLIGGEYRAATGETVGALATAQIRGFHAAHAVITVGGVSEAGVMDYQLEEAEIARVMISQARSVTVVADSSKFDRPGLFLVCDLEDVDRIVTDREPSAALGRTLAAAEVEVIVAPE